MTAGQKYACIVAVCKPQKQPTEHPVLEAYVTSTAWETQVWFHHCTGAPCQHHGPMLRALEVQVFKLLLSARRHQLFKASVNQFCVQTANSEYFPLPCLEGKEQTKTRTLIVPKLCRGPRPTPKQSPPQSLSSTLTGPYFRLLKLLLWLFVRDEGEIFGKAERLEAPDDL